MYRMKTSFSILYETVSLLFLMFGLILPMMIDSASDKKENLVLFHLFKKFSNKHNALGRASLIWNHAHLKHYLLESM
jgi:hypothetical protein